MLIDSHVLIWWLMDDPRLGTQARQFMHASDALKISIASVWELTIKTSLGRLVLKLDDMLGELHQQNIGMLSVEMRHLRVVAELPWHHRDPFDRLIIAQAISEDLPLLSSDHHFPKYEASLIDARR